MKTKPLSLIVALILALLSCQPTEEQDKGSYFDLQEPGVKVGGTRMIPIETPRGLFRVWTKRIGNNPRIKVLLLHGGPGGTHEYLEAVDSFFPGEGYEYYYYDQLGSYYSDQPDDTSLWRLDRFVEEVEQVRKALNLTKDNFYLFGQSWGGILAMEYALKYQSNIKGLIISNMMSSCPDYGKYADDVLGKQMDPVVLAEIRALEAKGDFQNHRYMELLMPNYYTLHLLRIPAEQWPDPVNRAFKHMNQTIYVMMQGPSEFGIAGSLADWDRSADLSSINVPTLVIGAEHDTMDPKHMEWMAGQFPNGRYLYCPDGSHMALYDDQQKYFNGLMQFIEDVDAGKSIR